MLHLVSDHIHITGCFNYQTIAPATIIKETIVFTVLKSQNCTIYKRTNYNTSKVYPSLRISLRVWTGV